MIWLRLKMEFMITTEKNQNLNKSQEQMGKVDIFRT